MAIYHAVNDSINAPVNAGGLIVQSVASVSRNGLLVAHGGVFNGGPIHVRDSNLTDVYTIPVGFSVAGLAFDPTQDILYYVNHEVDKIIAYDVTLRTEVRSFAIGANVSNLSSNFGNGNLTISPDGRWLALSIGTTTSANAISLIQLVPEPATLTSLLIACIAVLWRRSYHPRGRGQSLPTGPYDQPQHHGNQRRGD